MDTGHCRELVGLVKLRSKGPAVFVGSIDAANLRLNVIVVHGSEMTPRERSLLAGSILKLILLKYFGAGDGRSVKLALDGRRFE